MTWGAYGTQNPSQASIRQYPVSEAVDGPIRETAGRVPRTLKEGSM
jgi:hypothetical protein